MLGCLFFIVLSVEQVSHIAKLFSSGLQRLDLLAKLGLFGLLLAENLVDISHGNCLLRQFTVRLTHRQRRVAGCGYVRNDGPFNLPGSGDFLPKIRYEGFRWRRRFLPDEAALVSYLFIVRYVEYREDLDRIIWLTSP